MPENDAQHAPETVTPETAREKFTREQEARRQGLKRFGITPGFLNFAADPKPQTPPAEPATPGADWKDFERGQVSRRAALKKMGVTTGMAVFALFSVDDLARMVGKEMDRRAGDSKIADLIARELRASGVALADGPSLCGGCKGCVSVKDCAANYDMICQPCGLVCALLDCGAVKPTKVANCVPTFIINACRNPPAPNFGTCLEDKCRACCSGVQGENKDGCISACMDAINLDPTVTSPVSTLPTEPSEPVNPLSTSA